MFTQGSKFAFIGQLYLFPLFVALKYLMSVSSMWPKGPLVYEKFQYTEFTYYFTRPLGRVKSRNTRSFSEPSLLTGWLTNWLCCQPRFQFHEVKAVKIRGENCKQGCTPTFLSPLDQPKQCNRERYRMVYLCFNTCK